MLIFVRRNTHSVRRRDVDSYDALDITNSSVWGIITGYRDRPMFRPAQLRSAMTARWNSRAMLDAQASSARDNGKELVFNSGRKTGQQVDFTEFDNRSLAIVALNADASFSVAEASAAKAELNQRTRSGVLNAFDPGSGGGLKASTQALLQQYSTMSAEEKKVLGFTDEFANKIMQNYRAMWSLQNSVGSGAGLTAYF